MKGILLYSGLIFLNIKFDLLPNSTLLFLMGVLIALDFVTGVTKAIIKGKARTSYGFRRTITKFLQYGGGIAVGMVFTQAGGHHLEGLGHAVTYLNNLLVSFILYIEATSILENLIEIDNNSRFSKVLGFAHRFLTIQIKRLEEKAEAGPQP